MQLSETGLELIKRFEGFRGHVYRDVAGFPTIGYGHRLQTPAQYPDGISEEEAATILRNDVQDAIQTIERTVVVPLTQGQFDALVDFVFNLGSERLKRSTLLRALNGGRYQAAGEQLLRWDLIQGQENLGLRARRLAELNMWNASTPSSIDASAAKPVVGVAGASTAAAGERVA
ncbi:MAG: lysozyme [Terracidiphilus sp.]|nr:lysozyme [Terracidiphilus sp.]